MKKKKPSALKSSWLSRTMIGIETGLVILDLNPIVSEPIRFGTLFGIQAVFNNVLLSAICFGAITLLLDAFGAAATADLLTTEAAKKLINITKSILKKVGLSRLQNIKTGMVSDLSITLLVGTPITLILKHHQDPVRSRENNLKLGLILSAIASIVSALQGGFIVAGLWHPNLLTGTLAVLALISLLGTGKWLSSRLKRI